MSVPASSDLLETTPRSTEPWWRTAVVYQVYIRSFADGNGDGVGDVAGLRAHLDHLVDLGVDALWINPWYPSPMADAGYDVSDYRAIEPVFGTLAEAEALLAEAHRVGLRVLLDIVPNHSSDRHAWFTAALAAAPGSPQRARYVFRDGRGPDGAEPPNDWQSNFGGPAWTRVTEADGRPGQWYLHLFAPGQPDFDWTDPEVHAEFLDVLRFWFDRGVDGFRIDVAHGLAKVDGLPDVGTLVWPSPHSDAPQHPHWDVAAVHDIYREWRALADSYADPKVFVAEAWVDDPDRLALYLRPDELHTAFNFRFLQTPWDAAAMRRTIEQTVTAHRAVGAPATWVLANHDVTREVSRYARPVQFTGRTALDDLLAAPADVALGTRRARAAALLMLGLPGGAYVYQGQELGLPEVEDLPEDSLQDPTWFQSGHQRRGRDGCRVPIPWAGDRSPYAFGPAGGAAPWLPMPAGWGAFTAAAEAGDPDSMLSLYRQALAVRRSSFERSGADLRWLELPDGALGFVHPDGAGCLVNFGAAHVELPAGARVLLASGPLSGRDVPADTAVWFAG